MVEAEQRGLAEGRMEGLMEGLAKGHDEGRNEASLEIARNLKKMGLPITQIADGTGLSIETIEQIT